MTATTSKPTRKPSRPAAATRRAGAPRRKGAIKPSRADRATTAPKRKKKTSRAGMNKTGARMLGYFLASLIAWLWSGWGQPATGVGMPDSFLTALGPAMIVLVEWLLVKA